MPADDKLNVYISFRNTDDEGFPTRDRELAVDLLEALADAGANVSMSPFTLKAMGAAEYKRAIDFALDEANVLVVVGVRPEFVRSGWVRYEWSSFHEGIIRARKPGGVLLSYIEGMSQSDLPGELRSVYECIAAEQTTPKEAAGFIARRAGVSSAARAPEIEGPIDDINGFRAAINSTNDEYDLESHAEIPEEAGGRDYVGFRVYVDDHAAWPGKAGKSIIVEGGGIQCGAMPRLLSLDDTGSEECRFFSIRGARRWFTIIDGPDEETEIFWVQERVDARAESKSYFACRLDIRSPERLDGGTERTFFVDEWLPSGSRLFVLTTVFSEKCVLIYNGLLRGDEVIIDEDPTKLVLHNPARSSASIECQSEPACDISVERRKEAEVETREPLLSWEVSFYPIFPVPFDTADGSLVLSSLRCDGDGQVIGVSFELAPFHGLSSCWHTELPPREAHGTAIPLTDLEIGEYCADGSMGFPKDIQRAVEHLERDSSTESLYAIARVFATEPGYVNDVISRYYLELAADDASTSAIVELAIRGFLDGDDDAVWLERLKSVAADGNVPAMYLLAFVTEHGAVDGSGVDEAFELYCKCARRPNNYLPAQLRLSRAWDERASREDLRDRFTDGISTGSRGMSRFCLGSALLHGSWMMPRDARRATALLAESSELGSADASFELFNYYSDPSKRSFDREKATEFCLKLTRARHDRLVQLSHWLLDGKSSLGQEEADRCAFEAMMLASEDGGNGVAFNNLGWMHLHGRGCDRDYREARYWFERGRAAGNPRAIVYLGEMYELGLGVSRDIERARGYYWEASRMGSVWAEDKLRGLYGW